MVESKYPVVYKYPDIGIKRTVVYEKQTVQYRLDKLTDIVEVFTNPENLNVHTAMVAIQAIKEINKMQGSYAPIKHLSATVDITKDRLNQAQTQYDEY